MLLHKDMEQKMAEVCLAPLLKCQEYRPNPKLKLIWQFFTGFKSAPQTAVLKSSILKHGEEPQKENI